MQKGQIPIIIDTNKTIIRKYQLKKDLLLNLKANKNTNKNTDH